jgi:hypothetical protein
VTEFVLLDDEVTAVIPLLRRDGTQVGAALIDICDVPLVEGRRWSQMSVGRVSRCVYACARERQPTGRYRTVLMHRLLLGEPAGYVDHRNRNGLDNRRSNLRIATPSQNAANRPPLRTGSKGVRPARNAWWNTDRWVAQITIDGRCRHLGYFATEAEAATAYDRAALEQWGEFALVNGP